MRKIKSANENHQLYKCEATCNGSGWHQNGKTPCYALWEVIEADILARKHTDISGDTESYYGFVCPDCGCFTELNSKDIPYHVKQNARDYTY